MNELEIAKMKQIIFNRWYLKQHFDFGNVEGFRDQEEHYESKEESFFEEHGEFIEQAIDLTIKKYALSSKPANIKEKK